MEICDVLGKSYSLLAKAPIECCGGALFGDYWAVRRICARAFYWLENAGLRADEFFLNAKRDCRNSMVCRPE